MKQSQPGAGPARRPERLADSRRGSAEYQAWLTMFGAWLLGTQGGTLYCPCIGVNVALHAQ